MSSQDWRVCLCVVKGEQVVWGGEGPRVCRRIIFGGGDEEPLAKAGSVFRVARWRGVHGGPTVGKGDKRREVQRGWGVCLCICV